MTHEKDAQSRRACRFQNELYADYYLRAILYLTNDADLRRVTELRVLVLDELELSTYRSS